MMPRLKVFALVFTLLTMTAMAQNAPPAGPTGPASYFRIEAIDAATGRGIPLVKFTTLNGIAHWTDSAGLIAFHEPGLMGRELWFDIESHGYEAPADGFGYRGVRLTPEPGGRATVKLNRTMIAQRLYRLTGAGIYRDSILLGERPPIREPLLNAGVLGQDSTLVTTYQGKIFWIWGDTTRARYPLAANFKVTGAVSALPGAGGLDPETGVDFYYFMDGDKVKSLAPFESPGPVWLSSLLTVPDETGTTRLLAMYHLIAPPMDTKGRGRAQWNDEKNEFEIIARYEMDDVVQPDGHPLRVTEGGVEYFYFPGDSRFHRVRTDYKSVIDLAAYEAWTCLAEGTRFDPKAPENSQLSPDGWGWRRGTSAIGQREQEALIKARLMFPDVYFWEILINPNRPNLTKSDGSPLSIHQWFRLTDPATGKRVTYHGGSIYWNDYRQKWVMLFGELFGTSLLGEIWYAEADSPLGPWGYAVKVVTHNKYSLYNPVQHPDLAKDGGRVIFFEGTYTKSFSGAETPTPRYEYNQVMFMLDLADPRLNLPQPVYYIHDAWPHYRFGRDMDGQRGPIVFYALDRPREGTIPLYEVKTDDGMSDIVAAPPSTTSENSRLAFHALPLDAAPTSSTTELKQYVPADPTPQPWKVFSISPHSPIKRVAPDRPDYAVIISRPCVVWRPPVAYNPFAPKP